MKEARTANRVRQVEPEQARGKARRLFEDVQRTFGRVPNLFRVLGNAPVALEGYLNFNRALAVGCLDAPTREQIALTVSASNLCTYCMSAHTDGARSIGLTDQNITDAIRATATPARNDAILKLARVIVVQRGEIGDSDLERARGAGLTDQEIVEIVANVVLNIFTNYINHVARTIVDFPVVKPGVD